MNELENSLKEYKEKFNKDFVYNFKFANSEENIIKIINECLKQNIDAEQYYSNFDDENQNVDY